MLYSKIFGGSCLVKRINGKKNGLKTKIEENLENFSNRIQNAIYDCEKFYYLENVQIEED